MTPSELKELVEARGSKFFSSANMRFAGDTMANIAEDLDDAIEQGREWIEAGDWEPTDDEQTLDCCVREIVRFSWAEGMEVEGGEGDDYDTGIINTLSDDGETCTVNWESGVTTPCSLSALSRYDGETIGEIDEEATRAGHGHDCSGTLPAKDAPECIADEHD